MRFLVGFIFSLLIPVAGFADEYCENVSEQAKLKPIVIPSYQSGRVVIGSGRLQFYSAPDAKCKIKGVFVVPGDSLDASAEYGNYASVIYYDKSDKSVFGWVEKNRLKENGVGMGPDPNQQ